MTLQTFEQRLQSINPRFRIRQRGYGDIVGIYLGDEFIVRATKGELNLNGYRFRYYSQTMEKKEGNIMKRGRKTLVKMLERHFKDKVKDRAYLLWGVK